MATLAFAGSLFKILEENANKNRTWAGIALIWGSFRLRDVSGGRWADEGS